ncbi:MAG: TauD/TfdA family dioxygenase [Rhodospirillales bacterium]|nr:TauD/TfdA family dioxygenase [Rhodospirillales bacterium]
MNDTFQALPAAWMEHLVLFFHDQTLDPASLQALGRRFGPLHVHPQGDNSPLLQSALVDLDRAKLDLIRTSVLAPSNGAVTGLQPAPDLLAKANTPVMTFVDPTMTKPKPKTKLPALMAAGMKSSRYQTTKAELEEEIDMPGWSRDQARKTFIQLFVTNES